MFPYRKEIRSNYTRWGARALTYCIIIFDIIFYVQRSCGSFNNRQPGHSRVSIIVMCVYCVCTRVVCFATASGVWYVSYMECTRKISTDLGKLRLPPYLANWSIYLDWISTTNVWTNNRVVVPPPRISLSTELVHYIAVLYTIHPYA